MSDFPLPTGDYDVVAAAPGNGPVHWAGASCVVLDEDGSYVLAYRTRHGEHGFAETIVARSRDGVSFSTVAVLHQDQWQALSMERPALARTDEGRWRLYVCPAAVGSKAWWIDVLEADDPAGLAGAMPRTVFPGDERTAVKDPIIRRTADGGWQAWICCHPLDVPGAEDRMSTAYATSNDGLVWQWRGTALAPRPDSWDARGARLTAVLPDGRAAYDGRATEAENWFERTGLAEPGEEPGTFRALAGGPVADVRYLDVLPLPEGGYRIYYEARLPDESHELRTELIPG